MGSRLSPNNMGPYGSPPKYGGHLKSFYDNLKGIPPEVFLPIFNLIGQVNVSQKWNMHMITFLEDEPQIGQNRPK